MRSAGLAIVCLVLFPAAYGQEPVVTGVAAEPVVAAPKLTTISREEYLAEIAQMQALVERCKAQAAACGDRHVPEDAMVDKRFAVRWDWLQLTLNLCKDPKLSDRAEQLNNAEKRLAEETEDVSGLPQANADQDARAKAEAILAQPEFNRVEKKSYLAEKIAALMLLLNQLFEGTGKLLPKAWWIAPTLEYGTLLAAAIGVVLWAWRLNRQERLRIDAGPRPTQAWHAESEGWAERAEAEAGKANWREAVHCLYWSAIVMLEGQRLWLQNRARTPREYVNLLEPGSERRRQLSGLTRVFERIWYGLRPAGESDYRDAKAMLDRMRSA
jgi:hypothetical protein